MVNLRHVLVHMRAGRWPDAHHLVQKEDSMLADWLHGIWHLHEGDLDNAAYWYGRAKRDFAGRGTLEEEISRVESQMGD